MDFKESIYLTDFTAGVHFQIEDAQHCDKNKVIEQIVSCTDVVFFTTGWRMFHNRCEKITTDRLIELIKSIGLYDYVELTDNYLGDVINPDEQCLFLTVKPLGDLVLERL